MYKFRYAASLVWLTTSLRANLKSAFLISVMVFLCSCTRFDAKPSFEQQKAPELAMKMPNLKQQSVRFDRQCPREKYVTAFLEGYIGSRKIEISQTSVRSDESLSSSLFIEYKNKIFVSDEDLPNLLSEYVRDYGSLDIECLTENDKAFHNIVLVFSIVPKPKTSEIWHQEAALRLWSYAKSDILKTLVVINTNYQLTGACIDPVGGSSQFPQISTSNVCRAFYPSAIGSQLVQFIDDAANFDTQKNSLASCQFLQEIIFGDRAILVSPRYREHMRERTTIKCKDL